MAVAQAGVTAKASFHRMRVTPHLGGLHWLADCISLTVLTEICCRFYGAIESVAAATRAFFKVSSGRGSVYKNLVLLAVQPRTRQNEGCCLCSIARWYVSGS